MLLQGPQYECSNSAGPTGAFMIYNDPMQAKRHFDGNKRHHRAHVHQNIAPLVPFSISNLIFPSIAEQFSRRLSSSSQVSFDFPQC
jgi:hypothetical protein